MKLFIFFVIVVFVSLTGCDRKVDSAPKTLATPSLAVPKSTEPVPVSSTNEIQNKVQETVPQVKQASNASSSETAQSSVKPTIAQSQAMKEPTEQMLAGTIDHAREVTKSQASGSRQHAQKAEDEMSDMLKNK
jgi:hypothetical protein